MKSANRWLILWNIVLTVLFVASLAVGASWVQAASDPPVHIFTASMEDHGADGSSTTTDDDITTTTPDSLVSVTTNALSAAHNHVCVVTASADVYRAVDDNGVYIFGLSQDTTASTLAGSDRRIEFITTAGNDISHLTVSTVYAFTGVSGSHTFYFSARKNASGDANITVTASSIAVVCIKKQI